MALQAGLVVPVAPGCTGRSKAVSRLHSLSCGQDRWLGLDLCSAVHGTAAGAEAEQRVCSAGDIPIQPRSNLIGFILYHSDSQRLMFSLTCVLACSQAVELLKVQAAAQNEQPKERCPLAY